MECIKKAVSPPVKVKQLPQFFWDHLTYDLDLLSKALGLSTDDTTLIIHLILKGMQDEAFPDPGFLGHCNFFIY